MSFLEKTREMKLTKAALSCLRKQYLVCGHCGQAREIGVGIYKDAKVCEDCVKEALEDDGLAYCVSDNGKV